MPDYMCIKCGNIIKNEYIKTIHCEKCGGFLGAMPRSQKDLTKSFIHTNDDIPGNPPAKRVAKKFDSGKPRYDLIPPNALNEIAKVFTYGANKYGAHNFRSGRGLNWSRYFSAMMRHSWAWLGGEDYDKEGGFHHLSAVCCNAMILLEYVLTKTGIDDRWKDGKAKEE